MLAVASFLQHDIALLFVSGGGFKVFNSMQVLVDSDSDLIKSMLMSI
jgi:hypothetical protein